MEVPLARTKNVALGCFISFLSRERSNSRKSSAGDGNPAGTAWE